LVLLHTAFVDNGMWDEQFADFARSYRVIRFDMRGFGKSDPVQGPVVRRYELYQLMKHVGIEKAALIGCSLGGEVIIDFTLEQPDMVMTLVPVSAVPGGFEMQGEPPPVMLEMFSALQQNDLQRASELQIRLWVDGAFRTPDQVDPAVRQRAAEMNRAALANGTFFKAEMRPTQPLEPPAVNRLKEIAAPTLIVAGSLDHPEILRAAGFMAREIPLAEKVVLSGAAHVPSMEQPAAFNQAVRQFLNRALVTRQP
jgi:pimeloyl-ACP methyl ester carboxylesterase